uniref:Cationic amino acid transporter 9, chloroplastic n=1 Tax=Anthurium amnicola TaxID=1678845 RepID=A0A1D1YS50_9ARAE
MGTAHQHAGPHAAGSSSHRRRTPTSSFFSNLCSSALRRKALPSTAAGVSDGHLLVRRLGLLELILLGVGASIGAGIFVITGTVAHDAGPAVTVSFILAGTACILNGLCYAELSSYFPAVVGGAYLYSYSAFNELTAFLVFVQLMLDYHIGAASIARSLASYVVAMLELFPVFRHQFPSWIGQGGKEFFGGVISVNLLAPILLFILTIILCRGVGESSMVNSFMTTTKVIIVILVIFIGSFEVDVSNWSPFAPNGVKAIITGSTVVFFAYVGFDAVANSAEESKRPQRDLPIGILASLLICAILYVGVCLVITGMVPYNLLGEDAPLAEAFTAKGLKFVSVLISIGAVAGLTTTLLVGLYVQSRLYLGLGRDGLLPSAFAEVHPTRHTPVKSQLWVGAIAGIMAGLFNVHELSHILSVGSLTGYSVVSACVIALRWKDKTQSQVSMRCISAWQEGIICLITIACCGFVSGLCYRFSASVIILLAAVSIALLAFAALHFRQVHADPPGFSCPGVPVVPAVSIFFNIFLFAQLHEEAWWRFVILSIIAVGFYAVYGQYNADPECYYNSITSYQRAPTEDI